MINNVTSINNKIYEVDKVEIARLEKGKTYLLELNIDGRANIYINEKNTKLTRRLKGLSQVTFGKYSFIVESVIGGGLELEVIDPHSSNPNDIWKMMTNISVVEI